MDDLIDLKQSRIVKARPPTLTSIPALLSTFQNEWDAIILEAYQLKQQLAETRQELSTALYFNDSAQRVIARLQKERDEARDALARVSGLESKKSGSGNNGDAMQVDGGALPEAVVEKIKSTQASLMATRRKRPVPEDWATGDDIQGLEVTSTVETGFSSAKRLAADATGNFFLCGDSQGAIGVLDLQKKAITSRHNLGAGAVLGGAWLGNQQIVSTSSGAVIVADGETIVAQFDQHAGPATAVDVHPCGDIAVSVGSDKSYILYDVPASKVLTQIYGDIGLSRPSSLVLKHALTNFQ